MDNQEIKSLSVVELQSKIANEQEAYRKLKFAHAISPIENPMQIKYQRKLIAKLATELSAKLKAE